MKHVLWLILSVLSFGAAVETPSVFLEDIQKKRIQISTLVIGPACANKVVMEEASYSDYFLSMRPFKVSGRSAKELLSCAVPL